MNSNSYGTRSENERERATWLSGSSASSDLEPWDSLSKAQGTSGRGNTMG